MANLRRSDISGNILYITTMKTRDRLPINLSSKAKEILNKYQGIPPQVIMKWTGHSEYKSMKPYIDITEPSKAAAMRKLSAAWEK